jgi:aspartate racemase
MPAREKVVGVIGGMGPEATVDFLRRLVAATPARDDADHVHVIVDNNPKVPSRIAALIDRNGADPTEVLCAMARSLEAHGADFLVMPCNTAHHYWAPIAQSVHIPLLDMVALSIEKLDGIKPKPRRIGMLASPAVRAVGVYNSSMEARGFEALFPDTKDEATLLGVIRAVKAGRLDQQRRNEYTEIAHGLINEGAEALLIACSELSVIGPLAIGAVPAVDALDALVEGTIRTAGSSFDSTVTPP